MQPPALGEGRAPLPQAPKQNSSPPPQAPHVYKVLAERRIESLKLGRKWGRRGGGDKVGAGCSAQLRFGPGAAPRPHATPPMPWVRGRRRPPRLQCAPQGRCCTGFKTSAFPELATHQCAAQEKHSRRFLTSYYSSGTVTVPLY